MKSNKISYLLLSSTRVSGTGNGSGTYNLGQTLLGVTKIKLQHMSFYNTFYNVSATNNMLPNIVSAGTTYPGVAIPVGIYTTPYWLSKEKHKGQRGQDVGNQGEDQRSQHSSPQKLVS